MAAFTFFLGALVDRLALGGGSLGGLVVAAIVGVGGVGAILSALSPILVDRLAASRADKTRNVERHVSLIGGVIARLPFSRFIIDQYQWKAAPTPSGILFVSGPDGPTSECALERLPHWPYVNAHLSSDLDLSPVLANLLKQRDALASQKSRQDSQDGSELADAVAQEYGPGFAPWDQFGSPEQEHAFNAAGVINWLRNGTSRGTLAKEKSGGLWIVKSGNLPFLLTREESQADPARFEKVYDHLRQAGRIRQRQVDLNIAVDRALAFLGDFQERMKLASERVQATGNLPGRCTDCPPA